MLHVTCSPVTGCKEGLVISSSSRVQLLLMRVSQEVLTGCRRGNAVLIWMPENIQEHGVLVEHNRSSSQRAERGNKRMHEECKE